MMFHSYVILRRVHSRVLIHRNKEKGQLVLMRILNLPRNIIPRLNHPPHPPHHWMVHLLARWKDQWAKVMRSKGRMKQMKF